MNAAERAVITNPKLRGAPREVYLTLATFADRDGACWPSVRRIAEDSGYSPSVVERALAKLRDAGVLAWDNRFKDDGGKISNLYQLVGWVVHDLSMGRPRPNPWVVHDPRTNTNELNPENKELPTTYVEERARERASGWQPTPTALAWIGEHCPAVDPAAVTGAYRIWCTDKGMTPNDTALLRWAKREAEQLAAHPATDHSVLLRNTNGMLFGIGV